MNMKTIRHLPIPGWRWLMVAVALGVAAAVAVPALAETITVKKWPTPYTRNLAFDSDDNAWAPVRNAVIRLDPEVVIDNLTTWSEANPSVFSSSNNQSIGFDAATGNVWVGADGQIDRLTFDPITEAADVTAWPLASGSVCGTSVVVDGSGNAWFGQSDSRIAKLEPGADTITTWQVPAAKTVPPSVTCPQVIAVDGGGVWVCEANLNKIGRLNPVTNEIAEWTLDGAAFNGCNSRAADGGIWIARGTEILRLNPASNQLTSRPCPLGCTKVHWVDAKSADRVWFAEQRGSCSISYWCPNHRAGFDPDPAVDPPVFTEYPTENIGRLFVDGAGNVWSACDNSGSRNCRYSGNGLYRFPPKP